MGLQSCKTIAPHGLTTTRQRFHNATGLGPLTQPAGAQPQARVTYAAMYPDGVGRQQAAADYGSNGDTPLVRSATIPARSDTVLVNSTAYNNRGEPYQTTDPAATVTQTTLDDAGRRTQRIRNYQLGQPSTGDVNVTVNWTFTADDQTATMTAVNSATSNQTTAWNHGVTMPTSDVARNDVVSGMQYPDGGVVSYLVNANRSGSNSPIRNEFTAYGQPAFLSAVFAVIGDSAYGWETLFAGYRWDAESSFYLARNRWMLPHVGVWLSRDSYRVRQPNLYLYCNAFPIGAVDPLGWAPEPPEQSGPHFAPKSGCSNDPQHDEVGCITKAFNRAIEMLQKPNMSDCFKEMLNKIGSGCKSSDLRDCIITSLKNATFSCDEDGDWAGLTQSCRYLDFVRRCFYVSMLFVRRALYAVIQRVLRGLRFDRSVLAPSHCAPRVRVLCGS